MSSTVTMIALVEWVNTVTGLLTIQEKDLEPGAPRPDTNPAVSVYAAIGWRSDDSPMSTPLDETTDTVDGDNVEQVRSLLRSRLVGVEVFGLGAADYCAALELSLGGPVYMELFGPVDIAISKSGQVTDEPVIKSTTRPPDASVTFTVGYTDSVIESTPWVAVAVAETDGVTE